MTRFELASHLSRRLYLLTDEEKHSIIDKYVQEVSRQAESGLAENEAIALLGDIDLLADRILLRHHINPEKTAADSTKTCRNTADGADTAAETAAPADSAGEKFSAVADGLKNTVAHSAENIKDTVEKTAEAAKYTAEKTVSATKEAAGKTGRFLSHIGKGTARITFSFINLLLFVFIWMPCMFVTAIGIICTVATVIVYRFSGIGFIGICIAGLGCCMVGISFCIWLGNILTGGYKNE